MPSQPVPESSSGPPSYAEAPAHGPTPDDVIPPTILVLAGQTIHAESASSIPLYHLDRGITSLSRATTKVTFERVEHAVRTSVDNEPSLRDRRRHVFTLERSWTVYDKMPSTSPKFFARAVSRRVLGHVGLKKSRLRSAFTAYPVDTAGSVENGGLAAFVKDAEPVFKLAKRNSRWEWNDRGDGAIAFEDEGDDTHRLIVTASMPRVEVDALVALWCCRLWEFSADSTDNELHRMDAIRNKLQMGKEAGFGGLHGWIG
ncbi:hypothetical protein F5Y18DRAFT_9711 [Xylariaceae sp. FL1019]|nr:hypothetical protein F5Y18DRAFT_9711 [Xylariaceae sp. FL1019]